MEMIRGPNGVVMQIPNLSANNLLQKFFITSNHLCHRHPENGENREEPKKKQEEEEEEKDIELTLGLSLNGQFGTDPRSRKRKNFELGRSSSIPEGFVFDEQISGGVFGGDFRRTVGRGALDMFQLDRTRSLPVETELETETKRRRSEKTMAFLEFQVPPPEKEKNSGQAKTEKSRAFLEFQVPPPTRRKEEKVGFYDVPGPISGMGKKGNTAKKKKNEEVSGMEKARNILEDMPCVSTRDVGADGKRVEGFLYWYGGNKEEVKIVCVCHGSFLSPAEFVRHGGGTVSPVSDEGGGDDVAINPLRHIVVKLPSSSL
ncbi:hypothetical protein EUTSA_v10021165mg [Eutrema salsugineum]|uniref:Ninja-family protein n=1 Tax=Eutrema salsugineum TaxID=72664 RepID=V4M4L6_EUTSA|nr:ninja-family protein AFP4 [Eutrema salsugineum]ESQ49897.1 hypothetical protein EUTSA_v10021165mg [Eutrema salsugineum]